MRRSAFSDAQITEAIRELEAGRPAEEICTTRQVSLRTLYRWRRKFGALKPFAVQALRRLEQENRRLKTEAGRSSGPGAVSAPSASPSRNHVVRSDLGIGRAVAGEKRIPAVVGRYASLRLR